MTTVVVLQPGYLPWLGFFEQLWMADVFVYYDDVQYDKGGWRNRNRIKTAQGFQWLTVPVLTKGKLGQLILETRIDNNSPWWKKHIQSLRQSYAKAPFYGDYGPGLEEVLARKHEMLVDLNLEAAAYLAQCFGIKTETVLSSKLALPEVDTSERLLQICKHFEATHYFTAALAKDYLKVDLFHKAGISVEFQDYPHPTYRQLHGEFIPYLSAVDLLFNYGPESLGILTTRKRHS